MIVKFKSAFANIQHVGDFICCFALQIKIKNSFFRFCKLFQTDFKSLVVVGIYLVFTRISKPIDFRLSFTDFGGLIFCYDGKFVVLYYDRTSGELAMVNTEIPVTVTVTD